MTIHSTVADKTETSAQTNITFGNNRLLIDLCGELDSNLTKIETAIDVQINRRGNELAILGDLDARKHAEATLRALYGRLEDGREMEPADVDAAIRMPAEIFEEPLSGDQIEMFSGNRVEVRTRKKVVEPRTKAQNSYVRSLFDHELVFGLGPAGTGKTYLAMAVAVSYLIEGRVDRIILSRPAVEAGERLGFLPGDLKEKVDPYMQPLYDALNDFLPAKQVEKMIEDKVIEIAPLAFMRGRTLSNAVIILDEAQNTTAMQMKMFLTRMGENSKMIVTGDPSQVDLPPGQVSGLVQAVDLLNGVDGVNISRFSFEDVVRHPLVARIVRAYDQQTQLPGSRK
ncbi:MAG: PhoH family protein [Rhodobacteraceae bacterium]|nr:PhoH family protein [Paracoccaceae bacterium]